MTGIRRAFLWASAGRYLVMAINLAATLIIARLLAPEEYGVSVLSASVFAVAEAVRAIGGGTYLIQHRALTAEDVRTSFTVNLLVTIILATVLCLFCGPLAHFFNIPNLGRYLQVCIFGYSAGPFTYTISALMSREMAFGKIALIGVATALVSAVTSVCLALMGFSYMSFAWASSVSAAVGLALSLSYWKDWSIFRPLLRKWRSVTAFGAYDSAAAILSQIGDALPYLILGRVLNAEAVGLGQRAVLLSLFPERVILAGVGAVALPAFSRHVRDGNSLKREYLRAIEFITAAQWAVLVFMILQSGPLVAILLGPHWHGVSPLLQILATALLFSFPVTLHYPTMVAVGAIRFMSPVIALQGLVSVVIFSFTAHGGITAAACGMLLIVPLNGLFSLLLVRYFVGYRLAELAGALWRSAISVLFGSAGPLAIVWGLDRPIDASVKSLALFAALFGAGWIAGLWITRHPLLEELLRASYAARRRILGWAW